MGDGGVFRIRYTFPAAGEYHLFADVAPKGAGSQVLMARLKVSGKTGKRYDIAARATERPGAGCRFDGKPQNDWTLHRQQDCSDYVRNRRPPPPESQRLTCNLIGCNGASPYGPSGRISFVHSHPMEDISVVEHGTISFLARFPKPGLYRAWARFQRSGTIHTASFVFEAQ